jgi:hypothetical protein
MIQRSQHEHYVDTGIWTLEMTGIPDSKAGERMLGLCLRCLLGLLDVKGYSIDEVHLIPLLRQPTGINARATPHIENYGGGQGQVDAGWLSRIAYRLG